MNLRSALFGYDKQDVQAILTEFKRRLREMERLSKEKDAIILDYQKKVHDYKNKEDIINEALKDARSIANTILQEAETEAKELMVSTEALTDQQLANSREDIRYLGEIKERITQHETIMREELFKLIEQQRAVIESFDMSTFEAASRSIAQDVAESENIIQNSKIRVVLPPEITEGDADSDAIPLYALK